MKNLFDPSIQEKDLASKIGAGLERISQAFKALLWEKAKDLGLSPIQIQILVFLANHSPGMANVSHLAKEFNVTKPTISDAIKVLDKKGIIEKDFSSADSRSYTIRISEKGSFLVKEAQNYVQPLSTLIENFSEQDQETVFRLLSSVIYGLNRLGVLNVQRTCFGCRFYGEEAKGHYCHLLEKPLLQSEIRLDCPEFQSAKG